MHGDLSALDDAAVHADAGPEWLAVEEERVGLRQEVLQGILGVDAALDGVAALAEVGLRPRQWLAGSHAQLGVDQIDAGHHLGHRVLDLKPGIHLEEVEPGLVALALEQELHRAGVAIADRARRGDGRLADPLAHGR